MEPLERRMILSGQIVHGQQLGRQLGFPTANLKLPESHTDLPATGVYAAWAKLEDGTVYRSMVNIGFRPTVDAGHRLSIEAHLIGFEGELYGKPLELELVGKIRDERKMKSLEELKAQLECDFKQILIEMQTTPRLP